jgi:prepilin-type N-terminal cleavage/methylation domain-containing protein
MKKTSARIVHRASPDAASYQQESVTGICRRRVPGQSLGYTLIEVLITVSVIAALAVVTLPTLGGRGNAERLLGEAMGRVHMRRLEARHLRPLGAPTVHEGWAQPPIIIDFGRLERTAPLRIDGAATNYEGFDAARSLSLTHFDVTRGDWEYVYEGTPLRLPDGWRLAADVAQLPIEAGLIEDSAGRPRGLPVSAIGFDAKGRAWADSDGDGLAESSPETLAEAAAGDDMPFWAVYFTDGETAVAVAVHSTGVEEAWRWSPGSGWRGWRSRAAGE